MSRFGAYAGNVVRRCTLPPCPLAGTGRASPARKVITAVSAATSSHGRRPLPSDPGFPCSPRPWFPAGYRRRPRVRVMQRLADSRGPAAQPVIASAGELAPLVRGTARAHSRGSVFMALPPGPRRRGSKPGLLVATSMGSALEGVAIRGEWPHIAVTRVRPPSRTTLLPGCGNGPKNGPKTPYGAYRAILVPVRFRGADLLGVSGSVEHPGRIVLTSLSLRPVYLPQR